MKRILKDFQLSRIAAVDRPCQEGAVMTIMKRAEPEAEKRLFTAEERKKDAKSGAALPGGGFPIENVEDLKNAIRAIGRAKNPVAARRHIISRARSLNAASLLPNSWNVSKQDLQERITKLMTEDFDKSGHALNDCLSECDAADELKKLLKGAWEGWTENRPNADNVSELFVKYVKDTQPESISQLEKALDVNDQLHALAKRLSTLVDKAKTKDKKKMVWDNMASCYKRVTELKEKLHTLRAS